MLEVESLHVGYFKGLSILRGVSMSAAQGRITAILGANGVGKSTLLKAVAGFLPPWEGRITLDGQDITGRPPHQMVRIGIAYSPQQPGIFAEMSVQENVLVGAWSFRGDRDRVQRKLDERPRTVPDHSRTRPSEGGPAFRRPAQDGRARQGIDERSAFPPRGRAVGWPAVRLSPTASTRSCGCSGIRGSGSSSSIRTFSEHSTCPTSCTSSISDRHQISGTPGELGSIQRAFWTASNPSD